MSFIFRSTMNTRQILPCGLKFIRSDVPTAISQEEAIWLIDHNITTIIDLRTEAERKRKMCPLSTDKRFQYYCMSVTGGDRIPASADEVSKSYIQMVDDKLYETIYFMQRVPSNVLYFCNAGKDRTGVVSAILLRNAGFAEEYIVDDYMKSKIISQICSTPIPCKIRKSMSTSLHQTRSISKIFCVGMTVNDTVHYK